MSHESTEQAIVHWHEVVNSTDLEQITTVVSDPVVVSGPKGSGPITADEFAGWILRSGIQLRPRSWHPIGDRLMVVEQEARWPDSEGVSGVATVFRVSRGRVSAALRFDSLSKALEFATLYQELAATESREQAA